MMDIKRLDIYRKIPKDLTQPTTTGAVVRKCKTCQRKTKEVFWYGIEA